MGCSVALIGAGGATLFGMAFMAMLVPEAYGACAVICLTAF